MNKKQVKITIIFLILSIIVSTVAFAGSMIQLYCEKCGFKSTAVAEGVGVSGIENTIVYCKACKDFYSIPTKVVFKTELGKDVQLVKPIGKKEFLGEERLVFPCPKCEANLPNEIFEKVIEFEKSEKLNPPQEKRAKQILCRK